MSEIPSSDWTRINAAADRFERNWNTGPRPRIEDDLAEAEPELRAALLEELLRVELELRRRDGEEPTAEDYRGRFPGFRAAVEAVFAPSLVRSSLANLPTTAIRDGTEDTDQTDEAGTRVRYFGDYELLRELGRGGMGVVYKARQISLNRPVALKMIRAGALAGEEELRRFQNEVEAIALLDHPHIVPIPEVGCHEGQRYFSMKLIGGSSLDKKLDDYASDPRAAARLSKTAAEAVHHAHQRGILHRDLKPSNISLDDRGEPFVTDFGLAKRVEGDSELTHSGAILGTPAFMAPEQASGRRGAVTTASDVYGLGAILYATLTGQAPFGGESVEATLAQVRESLPTPPSKLKPQVPRDLEVICLKCLEKDPARRYASAQELADDLGRYLGGDPIHARPVGRVQRAVMWCRRNPLLASAVGTVAVALLAAAAISVIYATEQARATTEIKGLAKDLSKERESLKKSLADSNRLLAIRNFDRGQAAFEKGEIGPGLLWLIESWRSAVDAGDLALQHAARANLAAWRPHYPRLRAVLSHSQPVTDAAFSPDGRTVMTCSVEGTVRLWDVASGKSIGSPLHQEGDWPKVGFSPDGKTLLTHSQGNTARLWNATTGEPIHLLRLPHQVHIMAAVIQRDGKIVVAGTDENGYRILRLWNAATGKPIGLPFTHRDYNCAISPDGRMILAPSDDGMVRLWDAATGQPISRPLERLSTFRTAAFSPDYKSILIGGEDGTARLWDAATGESLGPPMRHESQVRAVAISPDGKTVLTRCQGKEARLWDAATGQCIGLLEHQAEVSALAFSPDGKTILTGSYDRTVRLWDAEQGKPVGQILEIPSTDHVVGPRGEPTNGEVLISWAGEPDEPRYLELWNLTTRQPIARLPQPGGNVAMKFSADWKYLLTIHADHTARLWDATTGAPVRPPFPLPSFVDDAWSPVRLGPDGNAMLFLDRDRRVWVFDAATGSARGRAPDLGGTGVSLDFCPDGKTFFTGLDNGEVRLWDAATVTPLGDPIMNPGGTCGGEFSPDGKSLLIVCEDGSGRLWDLASRKPRITSIRHRGVIYDLAFSPDGKTIASSSLDKDVRLWDVATGHPIGPVLRHTGGVFWVAFRRDGKALLTGGSEPRLFHLPPDLPDELARMAAWVEVITGLRLDKESGLVQVLDNAVWLARREQLTKLGGPPETVPEERLDPIIFGSDPTARARSLMERKQWDAAEVAFDEAMRARPFNISAVVERGDLYAHRELWSEAAAYYAATVKRYPDVAPLHEQLAVARLLVHPGKVVIP
jgi:WD40 repeat protein/tRNA A-37 threonylcarbamoyl transferase component Bud32